MIALSLPESETPSGEPVVKGQDKRSDERERGAETEAGVGHPGQEREGKEDLDTEWEGWWFRD